MELSFDFLAWSTSTLVGLLIIYLIKKWLLWRQMPPGPWGLPIFGLMFRLLKPDTMDELFRCKQRYGKIFSMTLGNYTLVPNCDCVIVLNDYKLINQALKQDEFSARPHFQVWHERNLENQARGILVGEGPTWNEQRRFALRNLRDFGFGKESMEGLILHELSELLGILKKNVNEPFGLGNCFNASVLNSLWYILTGKRADLDDPRFQEVIFLLTDAMKRFQLSSPGLFYPWPVKKNLIRRGAWAQGALMRKTMQEYIQEQIDYHKQTYDESKTRDFMDAYLHHMKQSSSDSSFYQEEGEINLLVTLTDLFVAGAETTSTTLLWAVLFLSKFPNIQAKIHEEIDRVIGQYRLPARDDKVKMVYFEAFLNEVHRKASLLPLSVYHGMAKDTVFQGYLFPKGSVIWPNIYDVHHDEGYWKDPHVFRPERFLDETGTKLVKHEPLIPFSTGKRQCLGEALARDTLFLFLTGLLQQFSFELDASSKDVDMKGNILFVTSPKPYKVIMRNRKE